MLDTCSNCLALLKPGTTVCPVCGTPVKASSLASTPRPASAVTPRPKSGPGSGPSSASGPTNPTQAVDEIFPGEDAAATAPGRPLGGPSTTKPSREVPAQPQSMAMAGVPAGQPIDLNARDDTRGREAAMLSTTPLLDLGRFVPGTMLGQRYRIAGRLGKGGMGEVYRADDLKLGQSVAMKFLPEELSQDQAALTRLINEVKIARQVSHPNVCRVYDIGEMDGLHFISMEFVDGEDLGTLLRRIGRLPHDKAVQLAKQICSGMQAAHEKGVLHRDLKPGNVMVDGRGSVRIMDFGLAGHADDLKKSASRAGTPAYMAPEQLHGKGVTTRSDIYSLGLVLYEMFTGKPAYRPHSMSELTALHERPLASPRTLVPEIPESVDAAVMRCIEREPAARHGSALQVAAALGGQDPLAAALAAGEMPSPELVASSGGKGVMTFGTALTVLGALIAALVAVAALNPRVRLYETDRPREPGILIDKSREVLETVGAMRKDGDWAYGFTEERIDATVERGSYAAMRFWYRESPVSLISRSPYERVGPSQPPADVPGMNLIVTDSAGKLVRMEVMPDSRTDRAASGTGGIETGKTADFGPLLKLAGAPGDEKRVDANIVPRVAADTRAAWEWRDAGGRLVHAEGAAVGGTPVYFEAFPRWPARVIDEVEVSNGAEGFFSALILYVLMYGGAAGLAWYNWSLGRGDRKGAARLALGALGASVVAWVLGSRVVLDGRFFDLLDPVLGRSLFWAAYMWVLYVAIEPFIRQTWPQSLISWTRLLSGEVRDGLVGRDLLMGCLMGTGWVLLVQLLYLFAGPKPAPVGGASELLLGLRPAVGGLLEIARDAVAYVFVILMVVPIARAGLRKFVPDAAVVFSLLTVVFVLLLVKQSGRHEQMGLAAAAVTGAVLAGVATYVLARFGALMLMAAFFTAGVVQSYPVSLDTGAWFFGPGAVAWIAVVGLAVFGWRQTVAKRAVPVGWN